MHTAIVIGIGLLLLAACVFLGRLVGGPSALTTSVLAPVFLIVFGIPALVALFLRWRFH